MYKPTVTDADLEHLKEERDRADRLYNEALTELDRAVTRPGGLPVAPAPPDTSQLARLNQLWQVVPAQPIPFAGWRGRLAGLVWRVVGPIVQRQQEFNAALVDHANRTAASSNQLHAATGEFSASVASELAALSSLQARLIAYLQQVTLYVDTKDRFEAGLLWHELRLRTEGLAAGLSALGDEMLKRREHAKAHEQRVEARVAEALVALRRQAGMEAVAGPPDPGGRPAVGRDARAGDERPPVISGRDLSATAGGQLAAEEDDARTYASFEDLYRGSTEAISEHLGEYVPLFAESDGDVLDVGCGRGEFLLALREHGIRARGIDLNATMVERCRAQGLDVARAEAIEFLAGLPEASLGGIFAAQVVEHLLPDRLLAFLDLAREKLRPGGRIVLETVNPACWAAFFSSYIRDITHVRPLHPDTLRYLLIARGFGSVDVRFSSPYPADAKLRPLPLTLVAQGPGLAEVVEAFNRNAEILNGQLFTYMDYAAVGRRA